MAGLCESRQICGGTTADCNLLQQIHKIKCLILKILAKVIECNIRNGPIWWKMSTFIKVTLEHFSITVFLIFTFQISLSWKYRSKSWCTIFAVAPFDGKYLISYLLAIVMFAFLQPIFVKIAHWHVWPWKFRSRSLSTTFAVMPFYGVSKVK